MTHGFMNLSCTCWYYYSFYIVSGSASLFSIFFAFLYKYFDDICDTNGKYIDILKYLIRFKQHVQFALEMSNKHYLLHLDTLVMRTNYNYIDIDSTHSTQIHQFCSQYTSSNIKSTQIRRWKTALLVLVTRLFYRKIFPFYFISLSTMTINLNLLIISLFIIL